MVYGSSATSPTDTAVRIGYTKLHGHCIIIMASAAHLLALCCRKESVARLTPTPTLNFTAVHMFNSVITQPSPWSPHIKWLDYKRLLHHNHVTPPSRIHQSSPPMHPTKVSSGRYAHASLPDPNSRDGGKRWATRSNHSSSRTGPAKRTAPAAFHTRVQRAAAATRVART